MTISSNVRRAGPFTGAGSTGPFTFAFKVFTSADLYVVKMLVSTGVETELALTTDYTVSLNADQNSNPGGTITLISALAVGYTLTITSGLDNLQPTDLTNQGGFYPSVITDSLDRSVIQTQQLQDQVNRSLKYPVSDSSSLSSELPAAAQRAATVLAFDSAGEPVVGPAVASVGTVLANIANINTVAGISADVTTVAGISANVTTVAGIDTDVTTVAGINGDVSTVSTIAADVTTVAGIDTEVTTVAGIAADATTVAGIAADVSAVSANVTDVTNFADVYQGAKAADPTLRNDGSALHAGDLYFNTVTDYMRVYSGSAWVEVVAGSVYARTFSGTGAQTNFTLPIAPNSENNTQVYISGVYQQKGTYSISGTTLIFSSAPPSGTNNIEVMIADSLPLGTVAWSGVTGKPLVDEIVVVGATAAASTLGYDSITMVHGGGFSVASGATFTIDVPFSGGLEQWFTGDGTVVFSDDAVVAAYPEWWGVDGTADEVEINKALAAARTVVLSYREYNIASTINIPMHGLAYFTPYQILGQGVSGAIAASYGSRLSWVGGNGEPGRPARVLQLGGNCVVKNINVYNKNSATALIGVDCSGDVSTVWPSHIVLENIYVKACGVGFAMIYCGCIDATKVVATLCGYGFVLGRDSNAITFNNITANSCTIGITDKGVITGKETFHGSRVVVLNSLNLETNTSYGMDIGDDRSNSWVINGLYAENNYDVALRPTSKVARLSGHVSITGGLINETGGIPFEIGGGEDICCLEFYNFWVHPAVTQLIDVTESTLTQFNSKSVKLPRGCTNITCIANSILNNPELISAGILNPDCYTKLETPVLDLTSANAVPVSTVGEDWITGASLTAGSYLVAAYMVVTADITPIAPSFNVGLGEFGGGTLAADSFLSGTDVVIGVYSIPLDSGVIQEWDSSAYSMLLMTNAATNGSAKFVFFLV